MVHQTATHMVTNEKANGDGISHRYTVTNEKANGDGASDRYLQGHQRQG